MYCLTNLLFFDIPWYLYTKFMLIVYQYFFSFLVVYIFPNSFKLFPLKYLQIHQFQVSLLVQGVFDHINYKNVYQIIKLHILYNISLYTRVDWIAQFLLLYYLFILFVNCYIFVNCYKLLYFCLVYQSKTNVKFILSSASNRWGF